MTGNGPEPSRTPCPRCGEWGPGFACWICGYETGDDLDAPCPDCCVPVSEAYHLDGCPRS